MTKSNEKTKTEKTIVRTPEEIDLREIEDLVSRAKNGDEVAKNEAKLILRAMESGFGILFDENLSKSAEDLISDLTGTFIEFFNREHGTNIRTVDELERYMRENDLAVRDGETINQVILATSTRPKDYVHTVGKLTDQVFKNAITQKRGETRPASISLDKGRKVKIHASINYDKVLEDLGDGAKVPVLTEDDRQVLDGIISNLVAGNKIMTFDMIYRGFSGKTDDMDIYIPEDIYQMINTALDHFRGILRISNPPEDNPQGRNARKISFDSAILHYDRLQTATINGKEIDGDKTGLIIVHDFPSLYKFAQMNGNEIDTRDIRLLNVPKINNTPENLKIKRYLYNRIIAMRNDYERNVVMRHKGMTISRKILFSSVFDYIGVQIEKGNAGRQKKLKIVAKIDTILEYWRDFGLIDGHEKTRMPGSTGTDGVEISFFRKIPEVKAGTDKKVHPRNG